jgi:hypothetical protein
MLAPVSASNVFQGRTPLDSLSERVRDWMAARQEFGVRYRQLFGGDSGTSSAPVRGATPTDAGGRSRLSDRFAARQRIDRNFARMLSTRSKFPLRPTLLVDPE